MSLPRRPVEGPVRAALVSGACVRNDAISYSLLLKLDLLRTLAKTGHQVEVTAFVQGTDLDDPAIRVRSLRDLLLDPDFITADIVVFEYGLAYELFDSLFALAPSQRSVGVYHNITPLELVEMPEGRSRVQSGLLLRHNLGLLDHVACDSEFNRLDLLACGLPAERLSVLALPPQAGLPAVTRVDWSMNPVEILFVGRLVAAKGIKDLLEAVALLSADDVSTFRLTLAGSARWSDPNIIAAVEAAAATQPSRVRLVADPDNEALERLYRTSSILALPSYHEGYCLPVLEAFHAGCQVVTSDAGNLPTIVADLGQVVPAGDVRRLSQALRRAITATQRLSSARGQAPVPITGGQLGLREWREGVAQHLARHSHDRYNQAFLDVINGVGLRLLMPATQAGTP